MPTGPTNSCTYQPESGLPAQWRTSSPTIWPVSVDWIATRDIRLGLTPAVSDAAWYSGGRNHRVEGADVPYGGARFQARGPGRRRMRDDNPDRLQALRPGPA